MDHDDKNSSSSYRKRLASLTTHLRKYEKPKPNGYDVYATSYISSAIPWKKILQDEPEPTSYSADLPPFTPKFEVGNLAVQDKERKLRGNSIRKGDILPSSQEIVQHFREASKEIAKSDRDQLLAYLYFKAMQYSEVNKAQALDERYPKPDCDVIRSTYSKEHQAAIATTLREKYGSVKAPFQQKSRQLVKLPEVLSGTSGQTRRMATDSEREDLFRLRMAIREALGTPMILREFRVSEEPWQFKAKAERRRVEQASKKVKVPWKRNVYPPKNREERIAELRAKAPPIDREYLETDNLPGLWRPELMIPTFKTGYIESKERAMEDCIEKEDDWPKIFETRQKCLEWLKSIPDSL